MKGIKVILVKITVILCLIFEGFSKYQDQNDASLINMAEKENQVHWKAILKAIEENLPQSNSITNKVRVINGTESPLVVKTTSGNVRGTTIKFMKSKVGQFLNIPYAEPPVGSLRFSKPIPIITPRKGILDGTKPGNACYQSKDLNLFTVPQSEDCLVLNIWSNINSKHGKPVIFYIHGGEYLVGSIYQPVYNGTVMATFDVVVVTVNYRLGPFGWLYAGDDSAPGNAGLYDQLLAIHWVKNNIRAFGGDPNRITLAGYSVGGFSISALIVSPLAIGMFQKAIIKSGSILQNRDIPILPKALALKQARAFAKDFKCNDSKDWLNCLRKVDANVLRMNQNITIFLIYETDILPVSAQQALKTGRYNQDIDIMTGDVQDEGSIWDGFYNLGLGNMRTAQDFKELILKNLPYPNLAYLDADSIVKFYLRNVRQDSKDALIRAAYNFLGDYFLTCPTYFFAKLFARNTPKRNVYHYYWTYVSQSVASEWNCTLRQPGPGNRLESIPCHISDESYMFGEPVLKNEGRDINFSLYTIKLFTNFAKTGNPMDGFPPNLTWPRLIPPAATSSTTKTKEINPYRLNHIIENLLVNNCDGFWQNYFV